MKCRNVIGIVCSTDGALEARQKVSDDIAILAVQDSELLRLRTTAPDPWGH